MGSRAHEFKGAGKRNIGAEAGADRAGHMRPPACDNDSHLGDRTRIEQRVNIGIMGTRTNYYNSIRDNG